MQITSLQSPHLSSPSSFGNKIKSPRRQSGLKWRHLTTVRATTSDAGREKRRDHKLVDENMIVLKLRIQELKMKDQENRAAPSDHRWMEWEKDLCKNYDSDVYGAIGFLQTLLMNTRPSLAIGMVALLAFSLSTFLVVILSNLLGIVM